MAGPLFPSKAKTDRSTVCFKVSNPISSMTQSARPATLVSLFQSPHGHFHTGRVDVEVNSN